MNSEIESVQFTSGSATEPVDQGATSGLRNRLLQVYCRFLVALYLFIAYALSIGPMFWLWYDAQYIDGSPVISTIYKPLLWTCQFPPISDAVNWYISFWIL